MVSSIKGQKMRSSKMLKISIFGDQAELWPLEIVPKRMFGFSCEITLKNSLYNSNRISQQHKKDFHNPPTIQPKRFSDLK
ncbi:hypothetical protein IV203_008314 [Nitzschia inconspicua]|uniref:Uncharacterized protein n=1 Tax=Nitzschia inconspicua TaxID=303405 RepID=A0A9K3KYY5_9STRA|nr:hypothetical protein IV203_008314 [Nitzschia inconspicua]